MAYGCIFAGFSLVVAGGAMARKGRPFRECFILLVLGVLLILLGLWLLSLARRGNSEKSRVHPISTSGLPYPYEPVMDFVAYTDRNLGDIEGRIFSLGNEERVRRKMRPCEHRADLLALARAKSAEMAATQVFALTDLLGSKTASRISIRRKRVIFGEAQARLRSYGDPAVETFNLWMSDDRFRRHILSPAITISAVGLARCATDGTLYITQYYGVEGVASVAE